jgi:hypothetical protein
MPVINTVDFQPLFTKKLIEVYSDFLKPMGFLRSFFKVRESMTKLLSIEVERGLENIAVDVIRGTDGNRNKVAISQEKLFEPPFFDEYFDATELDFYDRAFAQERVDINVMTMSEWVGVVARKLAILQWKIERAIELQCAQVFQTGIITLKAATNIDFKRKGTSLVVLAGGNLWTAATGDPITNLITAGEFIRTEGKSQGTLFNIIFGSEAWEALINNDKFKARSDVNDFDLATVREPQRNAVGANVLGRITFGSYKANCWGYPEFYDDANGVATPYIDPKKVIIIPENPTFDLGYAGVPMIITDKSNREMPQFIRVVKGQFHIGNYVDPKRTAHIFEVKSAPLAIPVSVDQLFTYTVVA